MQVSYLNGAGRGYVPADNGYKDKTESNADKFDNWTNSEDNMTKALNGENVDGFQMFDLDLASYSTDLKNFSQEYIDKWDSNGDGVWSKDEFIGMATAGKGIADDELAPQYEQLFDELYSGLNLDDKTDEISADEFATMLYASDVDWNTFAETGGDVAASIDGNVNFVNYQVFSSMTQEDSNHSVLQEQRKFFYDNFYA